MLNKTYSFRPHCVSCWTIYILQDDTRSLQYQVKMDLIQSGNVCVDSIELAQDRDNWLVVVTTLKSLRVT